MTPIPMVWELDGYEFLTICGIMVEEIRIANGENTSPAMSIDSIQAFGKVLESYG